MVLEGRSLLAEGKVKEAIDKFIEAEVKAPENPILFLLIGQSYVRLNDFDSAERSYKKALEIDPQNHKAYAGLGMAHYKVGFYEEAAKNFIESIALMYSQPMAHYYLGESLYALGDFSGAAKAFEVSPKYE